MVCVTLQNFTSACNVSGDNGKITLLPYSSIINAKAVIHTLHTHQMVAIYVCNMPIY